MTPERRKSINKTEIKIISSNLGICTFSCRGYTNIFPFTCLVEIYREIRTVILRSYTRGYMIPCRRVYYFCEILKIPKLYSFSWTDLKIKHILVEFGNQIECHQHHEEDRVPETTANYEGIFKILINLPRRIKRKCPG